MTNPEVTEFFNQRTEEVVGQDVQEDHTKHRSSFVAKRSTAQARKKSRGEVRLVMQYHFDFTTDELKQFEADHGRRYPDGVDFGRALLAWLTAEGKYPDVQAAAIAADHVSWEVAK